MSPKDELIIVSPKDEFIHNLSADTGQDWRKV